ncbi:MAG: NADH:flavin oxidoreductase [Bacteroidota bacterium]|nr:NADH:flavin oxidoreductase [Bacteroidota bacterium]MDP4230005.1 NADH:flavin oxidoreductase [Bacteroidota bacterium]
MFEKLLSPYTINGLTLPNRLVVPAMVTRLSGEDGFVNQDITDRYVRFAKGGTGLIVVEAMAVHSAKSGPLLRICGEEYKPGLTQLAKEVHATSDSKVIPQIIHFLKIARSGWRQKIEDLSPADIKLIIEQYGQAALRARECGYDGVELHMAHAYTMSSFLSKRNKRPDEFGGKSLENRLRVPLNAIKQVRKMVGDDFPIGVRFLGEECIKGGYTSKESAEIALRMAEAGVDYISLSAGGKFEDAIHKEGEVLYPYTGYSGDRCMPPAEYPDGYNLHMAEAARKNLRKHGYDTPVIATGKIATPLLAEEVLQSDRADLIGMARGLLADPDIIKKIKEGNQEKIVKCIYWNVCKALDETFHKVVCGLWPKEYLQAPYSDDTEAPRWQSREPLKFLARTNQIRLNWEKATDNEEVAGYEIWRSTDGGKHFEHYYSVTVTMYTDNVTTSGRTYQYYIRAYDLAGNKSEPSNIIKTEVPMKIDLVEVP